MAERSDEQQHVALVALDVTTFKLRRVVMVSGASEDERKAFYEALLKESWLSPEVRYAVLKALGRSLRRQKVDFNYGAAVALRHLIAEEKARMKKAGQRPRGGVHEAAVDRVARRQGVSTDALKKHLQRHRRKQI
jgi:hypothetical protein